MIVWLPTARAEVVRVAVPLFKGPVPTMVVPSRKVTTPEAAAGETIAVRVTGWPKPTAAGGPLNCVGEVSLLTVIDHAAGVPTSPETSFEVAPWTVNAPWPVKPVVGVNFSPAAPSATVMNAPDAMTVVPSFLYRVPFVMPVIWRKATPGVALPG